MTTAPPPIPVHLQRTAFDPGPNLVKLNQEGPIHRITMPWGTAVWLVTRYREIREVLGDAEHFSNAPLGASDQATHQNNPSSSADPNGFLLGYDPPEHTRLRKLLTAAFTTARMRRLRPRIEAIVTEALDTMAATGGPLDLVEAFALPVPSLVICELLGVPYEQRHDFQELGRRRLDMTEDFADRVDAARAGKAFLASVVATQRAEPGDGLIGMIVREHGTEIDDDELAGVADLLLLAGHETTTKMLALGTLAMLRNPGQSDVLRDPAYIDQAIEELLRYLSVAPGGVPRTALADVEIGGQTIRAGEVVMIALSTAHRDPDLADPDSDTDLDELDLRRRITSHLAFGHGIHHCLGAPLARMEMRIAFPALFDRFPTLRLAVPFEQVTFTQLTAVYGINSLPVTW